MKSVSFHTLGCKLNYTETDQLARAFEYQGYKRVPFASDCDWVVLNTCSVTEQADKKMRTNDCPSA